MDTTREPNKKIDTTYLQQQIQTIEQVMFERQEQIDALKAHQDADKKALKAYKESHGKACQP